MQHFTRTLFALALSLGTFTAAFAGYGGFFIPKSFGTSLALLGNVDGAMIGFILFYIICAGLNWWYYARKNAEAKC